jgi:hypothetical protein
MGVSALPESWVLALPIEAVSADSDELVAPFVPVLCALLRVVAVVESTGSCPWLSIRRLMEFLRLS